VGDSTVVKRRTKGKCRDCRTMFCGLTKLFCRGGKVCGGLDRDSASRAELRSFV
jgi:hypothetical protein